MSGRDPLPLPDATRRVLVRAFIAATLAGLSSILLLAISGWFLTAAAVAGAGGVAAVEAFNYLIPSASIRGLAIIRTVSRYGERLWSHQAALGAIADLRGSLFARLAAADSRTAPDLSGGDASARLIGDIEALEDLVVRRPTRPAGLIAALLGIGLSLFAGWRAALALAVLLGALPWVLKRAADGLTRRPAAEAAEALGELRAAFIDHAAARPEIIAYGLGDRVSGDLMALAARLDGARAALFRGEGVMAGLLAAYGAVAAATVVALARGPAADIALALLAGAASVEAMASFARTAFRQASVEQSLERLAALAELPPAPDGAAGREHVPALPVTLGHETLAPGTRMAIIGASGSGKTRLLEALAGLRQPVHAIAIGGTSIPRLSAAELRAQTALSPQDATLIAGSVADNLRLARPGVTAADMQAALATACLDTRIAAMPQGLDTPLGEGGGILSGGERKRLSLARALLAGRPWLVLDEPTEGLDAATESTLIERLHDWLDRTGTGLILVSHRPAPLVLAQRRMEIGDALGAES